MKLTTNNKYLNSKREKTNNNNNIQLLNYNVHDDNSNSNNTKKWILVWNSYRNVSEKKAINPEAKFNLNNVLVVIQVISYTKIRIKKNKKYVNKYREEFVNREWFVVFA